MTDQRQISTITVQRHMDRGGLIDWYNITVLGVAWIDDQYPMIIKDLIISSPDIPDIQINNQERNALIRAVLFEFNYHINNPVSERSEDAAPPRSLDFEQVAK